MSSENEIRVKVVHQPSFYTEFCSFHFEFWNSNTVIDLKCELCGKSDDLEDLYIFSSKYSYTAYCIARNCVTQYNLKALEFDLQNF